MKQRRTQGSILGFVLVGALLTALVVGGAFAAKRFIAQNQSGTDTVAQAPNSDDNKDKKENDKPGTTSSDLQKALEQQSAAEKKAQEQKAASEAANKPTEAPAASGTTPAPAQNSTPAPTPSSPATSTPQTPQNGRSSTTLPQTGYQGPTHAANLPETGPADSAFAVAGAALLVATGLAYRRSRSLI